MSAQRPGLRANKHEAKPVKSLSYSIPPSPTQNAQLESHFINITDTLSLNDSSKTEVRVQVMREYHRRRKQGKTSKVQARLEPKAPPSAKAQTQKFRLSQEKILRPWVRVKPYVARKSHPLQRSSTNPAAAKDPQPFEFDTFKSPTESIGGGFIAAESQFQESDVPLETNAEVVSLTTAGQPIAPVLQWPSALKSSLETFSLYKSPATGVIDPFSAMSLEITPRTQALLHHYFNVRLATSWLMMPMRKGLFSLAIHDAALFHTFMSHYVASYNLRFSTGDPAESMQHRTEAIRIVNERLQDLSQALSDGNIAAVANMAVYESSNGSTKSMIVHLNGLVSMVNMRGGIQNGGFAPHVRRLIGWTDLHVASALSSKPRFPPLSIPLTSTPDVSSLPFPPDSPSDAPTKYQSLTLDEAFAEIRALSTTMFILHKQSVAPEENIWYSDKIYSLQHRLFDILHSPSSSPPTPSSLDSAMCIAALIFCAVCLRDITFNFRIIYNGVSRLKLAIQEFLERHGPVGWELGVKLFWVLGMGGIAAEGKAERGWFVGKFRVMCGVLNLKEWENARTLLDGVLWQGTLDAFGRGLWVEAMAGARGV